MQSSCRNIFSTLLRQRVSASKHTQSCFRSLSGESSLTSDVVSNNKLIGQRSVTSRSSGFGSPAQLSRTSRRHLSDEVTKVPPQSQTRVIDKQEPLKVSRNAQQEHFGSRAPTDFDKRLLVHFGKYKTTEEVPSLVSVHALNSCRNKFRIYVNIFIGAVTLVGCVVMIYLGHTSAGKGDTLAEHNMKRHPQHYKQQLKD